MSTSAPTFPHSSSDDLIKPARLGNAALLAVLWAAGGNAFLYLAARALGVSFVLPLDPANKAAGSAVLGVGPVVLASAIPVLGAAALLAVLGRMTVHAVRNFRILSAFVLLLSLGPLAAIGADLPTGIALALMHGVAAVAIVLSLTPPEQA